LEEEEEEEDEEEQESDEEDEEEELPPLSESDNEEDESGEQEVDKQDSLYSKARKADKGRQAFKVYIQTQRRDGLYVNLQRTSPTVLSPPLSPPTQESQHIMQDAVDYHGIREILSLEALQRVSGLMEKIRRITAIHHLGTANDQLPTVGVEVDPFQFIPQEARCLLTDFVQCRRLYTTMCLSEPVSRFCSQPS
jgi:hypothetical protein